MEEDVRFVTSWRKARVFIGAFTKLKKKNRRTLSTASPLTPPAADEIETNDNPRALLQSELFMRCWLMKSLFNRVKEVIQEDFNAERGLLQDLAPIERYLQNDKNLLLRNYHENDFHKLLLIQLRMYVALVRLYQTVVTRQKARSADAVWRQVDLKGVKFEDNDFAAALSKQKLPHMECALAFLDGRIS